MIRYALTALVTLSLAAAGKAHFPFAVPQPDGKSVSVVFSETLKADDSVDISLISGLKLTALSEGGEASPLKGEEAEGSLDFPLLEGKAAAVFGLYDFGVMDRGDSPPFLLRYHPKAVLGGPGSKFARLGERVPVELVPVAEGGRLKFLLVAKGKPVPEAEVTVILPDGTEEKTTTGAEGTTKAFAQQGRFGAWTRFYEDAEGKADGEAYKQIRHYPTLVVDFPVAK